jgi:hypothetical protein
LANQGADFIPDFAVGPFPKHQHRQGQLSLGQVSPQ